MEQEESLKKVTEYMKAHWPSGVPAKWQVSFADYEGILPRILKDLTKDATLSRKMFRIAGLSGSGKTTQLLPAAEEYFETRNLKPVLVAARRFAPYHPHYQEILAEYGETAVRAKTDEFSTIMLFLTMRELTQKGYDIILDVTLLDPAIEAILIKMLEAGKYDYKMLLIAISPEIAEKHLRGRNWRHTKETEQEFIRATAEALKFYGETCPEMPIVIWNTYEEEPVYHGIMKNAEAPFLRYSAETAVPRHSEDALREAKISYLAR